MTKDDWCLVQNVWDSFNPFEAIRLDCDGYAVTLQCRHIGKGQYAWCVYVDGVFKGEWLSAGREKEPSHEVTRRFLPRSKHYVFNAAQRKEFKQLRRPEAEACIYSSLNYWTSFRSFKKHIQSQNQSISLANRKALHMAGYCGEAA